MEDGYDAVNVARLGDLVEIGRSLPAPHGGEPAAGPPAAALRGRPRSRWRGAPAAFSAALPDASALPSGRSRASPASSCSAPSCDSPICRCAAAGTRIRAPRCWHSGPRSPAASCPRSGRRRSSVGGTFHHGALYYDLLLPAAWLGQRRPHLGRGRDRASQPARHPDRVVDRANHRRPCGRHHGRAPGGVLGFADRLLHVHLEPHARRTRCRAGLPRGVAGASHRQARVVGRGGRRDRRCGAMPRRRGRHRASARRGLSLRPVPRARRRGRERSPGVSRARRWWLPLTCR